MAETEMVRVKHMSDDERVAVNVLTHQERLEALTKAGQAKLSETEKRLNNGPRTVVLSEQAPQQGASANARWRGSTDGTEMVTWLDEGKWYGCLQGNYQGNWFEGDDQGPFETRDDAEAELRDQYKENQQPPEEYPFPEDE